MIYGVKRVVRYLLGKDIAGRHLRVYSNDTFIVSYPRSGNTWTRFLIANLISKSAPVTFANIEQIIPDAEAQSSRYLNSIPRPRIIKSHEYFDHRYQKVIYIVRDPRDVALSYYNFQRKYRQIEDGYPMEQYVSDFVHGRLSSIDWGTWGENVGSWLACEGRQGFLLLRYEDMIADPVQALAKVAQFLNVSATPETLKAAVERSSASRMRELEHSQGANWVTTKNRRQDIPFVGVAAAGVWKSLLPAKAVSEIESCWGPLMRRMGYELMTQVSEKPTTAASLPTHSSLLKSAMLL